MVQQKLVSSEKTIKDKGIHQDEPELRFLFEENWKEYKLKDLLEPKSSNLSINDLEENAGDFPLYGASGFIKNIDFFQMESDYISIVKDGSGVGKLSYYESKSSTVGTSQYLLPKKDFDIHFLYYALQTLKFEKYITGSSIPHIYFKDYSIEKLKVPEKEEQEKIGIFFKTIDKKIELLEKKHSAYNQFFDLTLNKIFKQELVFDNKTMWKEVTLNDLGTFYRGHSYNSSNVVEQGLVVLRSNNIQNNRLIFDDNQLQHVNKDCKTEIKLRKGDIVICMSNGTKSLVGKSAVYEGNYENNLTVGAFCSIFRSSNPLSKYLLRTKQYKKNLYIILAGTNINNLKNEDIKKFKFKIPKDTEDIEKISVFLGQLELKQNILYQELLNFKNFKKALLQKMFI